MPQPVHGEQHTPCNRALGHMTTLTHHPIPLFGIPLLFRMEWPDISKQLHIHARVSANATPCVFGVTLFDCGIHTCSHICNMGFT